MIEYKDFTPRMLGERRLIGEPEFESLQDAVKGCNQWISDSGVDVVNVETVVLPNVHHPFEEGSEDVNIRQADDDTTAWNQFIRVWYRL